jgi:hypothetical protein
MPEFFFRLRGQREREPLRKALVKPKVNLVAAVRQTDSRQRARCARRICPAHYRFLAAQSLRQAPRRTVRWKRDQHTWRLARIGARCAW